MSDTSRPGRLPIALLTYVGWTLVTLFSMRWASDGTNRPLVDTVTHGVAWNIAMAVGLLALVTLAMRWRDLKFVPPRPPGSVRVLWFPALYLLFFALLVRTGSIWVPIAYHALWDFGTFVNSATSDQTGAPADFTQGWTWALPVLIVLPNFLYALFLLRKIRNDTRLSTD